MKHWDTKTNTPRPVIDHAWAAVGGLRIEIQRTDESYHMRVVLDGQVVEVDSPTPTAAFLDIAEELRG